MKLPTISSPASRFSLNAFLSIVVPSGVLLGLLWLILRIEENGVLLMFLGLFGVASFAVIIGLLVLFWKRDIQGIPPDEIQKWIETRVHGTPHPLSKYQDDPQSEQADPFELPFEKGGLRESLFLNSENFPITWDGEALAQHYGPQDVEGTINPRLPYKVTWEACGQGHGLYMISQDEQVVFVSTLCPEARHLLVEVLKVQNYPCEAWPSFPL